MPTLFSRLGLAQRIAAISGGLCLLVALALVTVGNLSSRYILNLQHDDYGAQLGKQVAVEIAPVLANGDLIGLEVTLEELLASSKMLGIRVYDLDQRQVGAAGLRQSSADSEFTAPVRVDGNIAGEVRVILPPSHAMLEQQRMAMGLLLLALLLSLFVFASTASWAQKLAQRLQMIIDSLEIELTAGAEPPVRNELEQLEHCIASLPLELLKSSTDVPDPSNYQSAGLLFIRLNSLADYVEALDESSLLRLVALQQHIVQSACELYRGQLGVSRQFGLLVSFSGEHPAGNPAFRAASTAWIVHKLIDALQSQVRLRLSMSLACGVSEAGAASAGDIYPGLYCQHVIDELAALTATQPEEILLSEAVCKGPAVASGMQVSTGEPGQPATLQGFAEPHRDLLERQQKIVLRAVSDSIKQNTGPAHTPPQP